MRAFVLILIVAACGDDRRVAVDAPAGDAGRADTDGMTLEPIALTITKEGAARAGVHVYFQHADSTLVADTLTDDTGVATARMAAGGFVTALAPFGAADDLRTFAGVQPGDQLVLDQPLITSISVTVTAPLSANAAVAHYFAYTPCHDAYLETSITPASGNPSGVVRLDGCGTTTDFLILATNINFGVLQFIYAKDVAVADGAAVDLTTRSYTSTALRNLTYASLPSAHTNFAIYDWIVSPAGRFPYLLTGTSTGSVAMPLPTFSGAKDILRATAAGMYSMYSVVDWGPYTPLFATNVAARVLPAFASRPAVDTGAHAVTWTEAAGGVAPDFVTTGVSSCRAADGRCWNWLEVAPRTGTSVAMPVLPVTGYDYNISAADAATVFDLVTATFPGGYDAVRAHLMQATRPTSLITGGSGSLAYEELAP